MSGGLSKPRCARTFACKADGVPHKLSGKPCTSNSTNKMEVPFRVQTPELEIQDPQVGFWGAKKHTPCADTMPNKNEGSTLTPNFKLVVQTTRWHQTSAPGPSAAELAMASILHSGEQGLRFRALGLTVSYSMKLKVTRQRQDKTNQKHCLLTCACAKQCLNQDKHALTPSYSIMCRASSNPPCKAVTREQ